MNETQCYFLGIETVIKHWYFTFYAAFFISLGMTRQYLLQHNHVTELLALRLQLRICVALYLDSYFSDVSFELRIDIELESSKCGHCAIAMEPLNIGEVHQVLEGHAGDVNSTAWSPTDKDTLVSCGGDKKIRVWKIGSSLDPQDAITPVHTVVAHELYIKSCAYNPSGDLLVTTSSDETIKLWSTVSWACIGEDS